MDLIRRNWLREAMSNFFNGLTHEVTEEDIQRYIEVAPSAFEGMTNGEVMKAVFPNAKITMPKEPLLPISNVIVDYDEDHYNYYRLSWWDSPYKGVSE